jgi:hypothetical protein
LGVVVKDWLAARKQQRHLFPPVHSAVLGNEGPTTLKCCVGLAIPGIILHLATNQLQKTSTAKYVDELRIHPEKGFMIVKGNSHVIGKRLKQKVILMCGWHEICTAGQFGN